MFLTPLLLLLGLLAAGGAGVWLYGRREDAGVVRASTVIERSAPDVWTWLTEGERLVAWIDWLREVRALETGDGEGVGAKDVFVLHDPTTQREQQIEVTTRTSRKFERIDLDLAAADGLDGTVRYALTDLGERRTRLDYEGTFRFRRWFARWAEPFVTPQTRLQLAADLARLKALAEGTDTE
jgi:hypothetical protein